MLVKLGEPDDPDILDANRVQCGRNLSDMRAPSRIVVLGDDGSAPAPKPFSVLGVPFAGAAMVAGRAIKSERNSGEAVLLALAYNHRLIGRRSKAFLEAEGIEWVWRPSRHPSTVFPVKGWEGVVAGSNHAQPRITVVVRVDVGVPRSAARLFAGGI